MQSCQWTIEATSRRFLPVYAVAIVCRAARRPNSMAHIVLYDHPSPLGCQSCRVYKLNIATNWLTLRGSSSCRCRILDTLLKDALACGSALELNHLRMDFDRHVGPSNPAVQGQGCGPSDFAFPDLQLKLYFFYEVGANQVDQFLLHLPSRILSGFHER